MVPITELPESLAEEKKHILECGTIGKLYTVGRVGDTLAYVVHYVAEGILEVVEVKDGLPIVAEGK